VTTTASEISTQQRIHLAALRLFSRQGYAGTGIRELADEAGLSPASLYNHIGSKEDLLVRIMREGNERLERTADAALVGIERPEVRLARLTQVHVFVHGSFRQECRVIDAEFSELGGPQRQVVLDQRDAYEALWASALAAGAESGVLSVPDARVTRLALLSMCTGVAHWFRPEGPNDVFDISLSHVDLVLATTRATRGRRAARGADLPLLDRAWFDLALPDQPDRQPRS
jgi:AcrR family transcriptional regulator